VVRIGLEYATNYTAWSGRLIKLVDSQASLDFAIVVLSCDRYSDLWNPCFELLLSAWRPMPHATYLCSNRLRFDDDRVTTLLSGDDPDWSTSISRSLSQIDYEYVLLLFDDTFFDEEVQQDRVALLKEFLRTQQPTYLRFRPSPLPDELRRGPFGRIRESTLYRTSTLAFWHRKTLLSLIKPGESAWEFEYNSPARAKHLPHFYGVYEKFFSYIHGVEKGFWIPGALERVQRLTNVDTSRRPIMSAAAYRSYRMAMVRERVFDSAPAWLRPKLLASKRFLFGSRRS
jgi:hypothetical protein